MLLIGIIRHHKTQNITTFCFEQTQLEYHPQVSCVFHVVFEHSAAVHPTANFKGPDLLLALTGKRNTARTILHIEKYLVTIEQCFAPLHCIQLLVWCYNGLITHS